MFLKRGLYRVKRTVLLMGDFVLSALSRSPGCAQCGSIRPRMKNQLCASLPHEDETDLVSTEAPCPAWPGFRSFFSLGPSAVLLRDGAPPLSFRSGNSRLPPEAMLHDIPDISDRYVVLFRRRKPETACTPGDYFTPNGIPLISAGRGTRPPDMIAGQARNLYERLERGGGAPFPGLIPDAAALPLTKAISADLARFLEEMPEAAISPGAYRFAAAHWMLAFGRAIPAPERSG